MGLFDGFGKHLASIGQDIAKQAGPAAAAAWQHAEKLGQEAGRHLAPAGTEAWHRMVEVADRAAPAASDAFQDVMASVQDGAAQVKEWDWAFMEDFGHEAGKRVGATSEDVWAALMSGHLVQHVQQQSATFIDAAQEHLPAITDRVLLWIKMHPTEAAALVACILAAPTAMAMTPAALGLAGFTSGGISAGSLAAGIHAGIGNVAAGSAFAILTSAGHGGMGLTVLNAIAASTAVTGTCVPAAVSFLDAMKENEDAHQKKI